MKKEDILRARVTPSLKKLVEKYAEITGRSSSDIATSAIYEYITNNLKTIDKNEEEKHSIAKEISERTKNGLIVPIDFDKHVCAFAFYEGKLIPLGFVPEKEEYDFKWVRDSRISVDIEKYLPKYYSLDFLKLLLKTILDQECRTTI